MQKLIFFSKFGHIAAVSTVFNPSLAAIATIYFFARQTKHARASCRNSEVESNERFLNATRGSLRLTRSASSVCAPPLRSPGVSPLRHRGSAPNKPPWGGRFVNGTANGRCNRSSPERRGVTWAYKRTRCRMVGRAAGAAGGAGFSTPPTPAAPQHP